MTHLSGQAIYPQKMSMSAVAAFLEFGISMTKKFP